MQAAESSVGRAKGLVPRPSCCNPEVTHQKLYASSKLVQKAELVGETGKPTPGMHTSSSSVSLTLIWYQTLPLKVHKQHLEEHAMVELCPCAQSKIDRCLAKRFSVLSWPLGYSFKSFLEELQIFLLAVLLSEPISVSWSCLLKALKL